VTGVHAPDAAFVTAQLDAVFDDIRIDAVKIGMLANASIVHAVAEALRRYAPRFVVLDTVMISKSAHALLAPDAVDALRSALLPLATVVTPNLPKRPRCSAMRTRRPRTTWSGKAALLQTGARAVLMKGGHLPDAAVSPDWLVDAAHAVRLDGARMPLSNTHGTGCTLASAIAALLPQRPDLDSAVRDAKTYLTGAIAASGRLDVGRGVGPVHHFHRWW
jgi:hydroxymethylpyrimidine/phosphomethylpyrimidine kinase